MKRIILAGNLPYITVLILCGAAFFVGRNTVTKEPPRFAMGEKSAVIAEAVLNRSGPISDEYFDKTIKKPVLAVLKKYADQGYIVVDVYKDEQGYMSVAAAPSTAIDITQEMRNSIKKASTDAERTQAAQGAGK